jgi:hypothetical protein
VSANPEIGRELSAAELVVKTVVVISREGRAGAATAWVREIGLDFVAFFLGVGNITLLLYIREDGKLVDDTGGVIQVFEYLGAV